MKLCDCAQAFWRPCISFVRYQCEDDSELISFTPYIHFYFIFICLAFPLEKT